MKDHKIIVTRDKYGEGNVKIWPQTAFRQYMQCDTICGSWLSHGPVAMKPVHMTPNDFRSIYNFLPRKGSKAVYVLRKEGE